jgi:ribosomal protein L11 methyltransferase
MKWVEMSISAGPDEVEKATAILGRYGQGGAIVEERESENTGIKTYNVKTYLPNSRTIARTRSEIETRLAQDLPRVCMQQRLLKPEDWLDSLKQHFGILEIGDKFIIKPSWVSQALPESTRTVIELDPGIAFGTGLHPTTRSCLLRLQKHLRPGMSVLDLGTGSGILAIAAAKLGASTILALDINAVAVRAARNNAKANGVDSCIQVKRGTISVRARRDLRDRFDLTLANITARAISDLAPGFFQVLQRDGILIASGIHPQGLDEVLIRLALADFELEAVDQEGEWHTVVARKP